MTATTTPVNRTDRAILRALLALGGAGTMGEIRWQLGQTGYTISNHQHGLERDGLITTRQVERLVEMGTVHTTTTVTVWALTDAGRAALGVGR